MGNSAQRGVIAPQQQQDLRSFFHSDLSKFILQKKIGDGKVMKSYLMKADGVQTVVKVHLRVLGAASSGGGGGDEDEDAGAGGAGVSQDEELRRHAVALTRMLRALGSYEHPNLLPYQMWCVSNTRGKAGNVAPVYLVRQYCQASLYDRLSTRPFLTYMEKKWLTYLLLRAVETIHEKGFCHGDIKPENVLVTSWNWLILTDFAPFKPTYLPDDDTTDYNYFFSGARSSCYVAPERFVPTHGGSGGGGGVPGPGADTSAAAGGAGDAGPSRPDGHMSISQLDNAMRGKKNRPGSTGNLIPPMDIFSVGCVLVELFTDGDSFLDLPALLQLRTATLATGPGSVGAGAAATAAAAAAAAAATANRIGSGDTGAADGSNGDGSGSAPGSTGSAGPGGDGDGSVSGSAAAAAAAAASGGGIAAANAVLANRISQQLPGDAVLRALVRDMTNVDPHARSSAREYRERMEKEGWFPPFFSDFLFDFFVEWHRRGTSPDDRIALLCTRFSETMHKIVGQEDVEADTFLKHALSGYEIHMDVLPKNVVATTAAAQEAAAQAAADNNAGNGEGSVRTESTDSAGAVPVAPGVGGVGPGSPPRPAHPPPGTPNSASRLSQATRSSMMSASGAPRSSSSASPGTGAGGYFSTQGGKGGGGGDGDGSLADQPLNVLLAETNKLIAEVEASLQSVGDGDSDDDGADAEDKLNGESKEDTRHIRAFGDTLALRKQQQGADAALAAATSTSRAMSAAHEVLQERKPCEEIILLVQLACSCLRHVRLPQMKLISLYMLVRFASKCDDEAVLQRLVPFVVSVLDDDSAAVRACGVRVLRSLLGIVEGFSAFDAYIFPKYIFPALNVVAKDTEDLVRLVFTESLGRFAETSRRYLDIAYLMKQMKVAEEAAVTPAAVSRDSSAASAVSSGGADGGGGGSGGSSAAGGERDALGRPGKPDLAVPRRSAARIVTGDNLEEPAVDGSYDTDLAALHDQVSRWIRDILGVDYEDSSRHSISALVKRVLLADIARLCRFFGVERTIDLILPQLLTFLNDRDWELRRAFCEHIPQVCSFVGPIITTDCILPCIETTITDVEELVVAQAITSLHTLLQLDLMLPTTLLNRMDTVLCLVLHPCERVRSAAIKLLACLAQKLGSPDVYVSMLPLIRPFLDVDLLGVEITEASLQQALMRPVSRGILAHTLTSRARRDIGGSLRVDPAHIQSSRQASNNSYHSPNTGGGGNPTPDFFAAGGSGAGASDGSGGNPKTLQHATSMGSSGNSHASAPARGKLKRGSTMAALGAALTGGGSGGSNNGPKSTPAPTSSSQMGKHMSIQEMDFAGLSSALGDDISAEDAAKLRLMDTYLTAAAREMMNKSREWDAKATPDSRDALYATAAGLHANAAESVIVPNIKVSWHSHASASVRSALLNNPDSVASDAELIQAGYGITSRVADAVKQAALDDPLFGGDPYSEGDPAGDGAGGGGDGTPGSGAGSGAGGGTPGASGRSSRRKLSGLPSDAEKLAVAAAMQSGGVAMGMGAGLAAASSSGGGGGSGTAAAGGGGGAGGVGGDGGPQSAADAVLGRLAASTLSGGFDAEAVVAAGDQDGGAPNTGASADAEDARVLFRRIQALKIPPLPPDLGNLVQPEGHPFSIYTESLSQDIAIHGARRSEWRPRPGVLVFSVQEHTQSVHRLAVAQDQTFFASASADKTVKIWKIRGMERAVNPRSVITYAMHRESVLDVCMCDNSHSVASASADGSLHVWRVDIAVDQQQGNRETPFPRMTPTGSSVIRTVETTEGAITNVLHMVSDKASILIYCTQQGFVHGFDLRQEQEAFVLRMPPELGVITALTAGMDRTWICVGTNFGFVALWDMRYHVMSKLWRHSSRSAIHRLASSRNLPRAAVGGQVTRASEGAYLFIAAGVNEAGIYALPHGGAALRCFRAQDVASQPLDSEMGGAAAASTFDATARRRGLPTLDDVPLPDHPLGVFSTAAKELMQELPSTVADSSSDLSVRAIMGRISNSGSSFVITAGSDRHIRYWDFLAPARCYTISGLVPGQPKPSFEATSFDRGSIMFTCHETTVPTTEATLSAHLPVREQRGPGEGASLHRDAILDLKSVELPLRMMLSSSRDGVIKAWG